MKKRRKNKWIHPKILYICLSVLCVLLVLLSFKFTDRFAGPTTVTFSTQANCPGCESICWECGDTNAEGD